MYGLFLAGCILVAFSVPFLVFLMIIARRSQLTIIMMSSAFFWLICLLLVSLLWYIIPTDSVYWLIIPLAVVFQEVARGVFIKLYAHAERSFSVVSTNAIAFPMTDLYSSIAAGVGFGGTHSVILYGSVLSSAWGPGTLFSPECTYISTFVLSAWNSFLFNLLHIFLMMIAFDGYRRMSYPKIGFVATSHMTASLLTLVNTTNEGCRISLPLIAGVVVVTAIVAFFVIRQPNYRSKKRA